MPRWLWLCAMTVTVTAMNAAQRKSGQLNVLRAHCTASRAVVIAMYTTVRRSARYRSMRSSPAPEWLRTTSASPASSTAGVRPHRPESGIDFDIGLRAAAVVPFAPGGPPGGAGSLVELLARGHERGAEVGGDAPRDPNTRF